MGLKPDCRVTFCCYATDMQKNATEISVSDFKGAGGFKMNQDKSGIYSATEPMILAVRDIAAKVQQSTNILRQKYGK